MKQLCTPSNKIKKEPHKSLQPLHVKAIDGAGKMEKTTDRLASASQKEEQAKRDWEEAERGRKATLEQALQQMREEAYREAKEKSRVAQGYNRRGVLEFAKGDSESLEQAIQCYSLAISFDRTNLEYFANRAVANAKLLKHDEAIEDAQACIVLDPNDDTGYCLAARSLKAINETEESYHVCYRGLLKCPGSTLLKEHYFELEAEEETSDEDDSPPNPFSFISRMMNPEAVQEDARVAKRRSD